MLKNVCVWDAKGRHVCVWACAGERGEMGESKTVCRDWRKQNKVPKPMNAFYYLLHHSQLSTLNSHLTKTKPFFLPKNQNRTLLSLHTHNSLNHISFLICRIQNQTISYTKLTHYINSFDYYLLTLIWMYIINCHHCFHN